MKEKELNDIEREVLACKKCGLYKQRKNPVPGEGSASTNLLLVGEAPGKTEDIMGRPFVGKAGMLLEKTLLMFGIKRKEVYITNVVKCRPPNNRTPTEIEINACKEYLYRQIKIISPNVILTLGTISTSTLLGIPSNKTRMSTIHGKTFHKIIEGKKVKIIPTYHPAAILRNPKLRKVFESDVRKAINESRLAKKDNLS